MLRYKDGKIESNYLDKKGKLSNYLKKNWKSIVYIEYIKDLENAPAENAISYTNNFFACKN